MDINKFAEICEKSGAKQIKKFAYRGTDVYIADGVAPLVESGRAMSYRTIVALGGTKFNGGKMNIAQPIYFDMSKPANRILQKRVDEAVKQGKFLVDSFIKVEKESGREESQVN